MILANSNIWISLATISFYELTVFQCTGNMVFNQTMILLFFSSLFIYNLFQVLGDKSANTFQSISSKYTKAFIIVSLPFIIFNVWFISKEILLYFIIASILTFFYVSPSFKFGKNRISLRKYWFLKSILVASVWTILTSIIPGKEFGLQPSNEFLFHVEKFLFVLGITIPYDTKDIFIDRTEEGMNTIPMKFGLQFTKRISVVILLLGLGLALMLNMSLIIPIVLTYTCTIFIIMNITYYQDKYWFTFYLDGVLILYLFFVWIYYKLSFFV